MRLLHISDTHLGRKVAGNLARDAEFDGVIDEIVAIAQDQRPDLIVHSGDFFDTWQMSPTELKRALQMTRRLAAVAPMVAIAGNHDSPGVFRLLDEVFDDGAGGGPRRRVRFVDRPMPAQAGGILTFPARDGMQTVRVAALPFVHPNRAYREFRDSDAASRSYADLLARVFADLGRGLDAGRDPRSELRVLVAHQYIEGAVVSATERRIGTEDAQQSGVLPRVEYAAIGHIHKPQAIARTDVKARYAGSPLQLDFGEEGQEKSVVVVEANPGRPTRIEPIVLRAGRTMKTITGTFPQIAASADRVGNAYVKAVVEIEDDDQLYLVERVAKALPRATVVNAVARNAAARTAVVDHVALLEESRDITEDFREFLAQENFGGARAEALVETLTATLALVGEERAGTGGSAEERLLLAAVDAAGCCTTPDASTKSGDSSEEGDAQ